MPDQRSWPCSAARPPRCSRGRRRRGSARVRWTSGSTRCPPPAPPPSRPPSSSCRWSCGTGARPPVLAALDAPRTRDGEDRRLVAELGRRVAALVAEDRAATLQARLNRFHAALAPAHTPAEVLTRTFAEAYGATGQVVYARCPDQGVLRLVHAVGPPSPTLGRSTTLGLEQPTPLADAARRGRRCGWATTRLESAATRTCPPRTGGPATARRPPTPCRPAGGSSRSSGRAPPPGGTSRPTSAPTPGRR